MKHLFLGSALKLRMSFGQVFFVFLLTAAMLCLSFEAEATHYRHGTLTWKRVSATPTTVTIEFKASMAYRRSYPLWSGAGVGSVISEGFLNFGNGSSAPVQLQITSATPAEDWIYGTATITKTYPATTQNYLAFWNGCCRLSSLVYNGDLEYRLETIVNINESDPNNAPVCTLPPIINMPVNQTAATFTIPYNDPDGDAATFRFATGAELGYGAYRQPNGTTGDNPIMNVNPTTGQVIFNTNGRIVGQLYSAGFVVSDGRTKTMSEVIIRITGPSIPPVFDYSVTPTNGNVYTVSPGENVNFDVKATDAAPAGDQVTLQALGLPTSGVTLTPGLPITGNPVMVNFDWTPTMAQIGSTVITFTAEDMSLGQTTTSVTIVVSLEPQFVAPTPTQGTSTQFEPGTAIAYTIKATDPDPDDEVSLTATNIPAGAAFVPGPAANPTTGQFDWMPAVADWGPHTLAFEATDSYGDKANWSFNVVINSQPSFTSAPPTSVVAGTSYSYTITTTDPDLPFGDLLHILAPVIPAWLTFTDNGDGTATLSGTPAIADAGLNPVNLVVEDIYHHGYPSPAQNFQSFSIEVIPCNLVIGIDSYSADICPGTTSGFINTLTTGGTAPVTYTWTGSAETTANLNGLSAGTYTVTVTDINGCTADATATIGEFPAVAANAGPDLTTYFGYLPTQCATLTGSGSGGTGTLDLLWSTAETTPEITVCPSAPTAYQLTVTDANGCQATDEVLVNAIDVRCGYQNNKVTVCHNGHNICISPNGVQAHLAHGCSLGDCQTTRTTQAAASVSLELTASPNPFLQTATISIRNVHAGNVLAQVFDVNGRLVQQLFIGQTEAGISYQFEFNGATLPAGIYVCRVSSNTEVVYQKLILVK